MTKMEENMLFAMTLADKKGGVITVEELQTLGVTRKAIYELVKYEYLEKVDLGVYRKKGVESDVLYEIQKQFPGGVFSLETSLYIHNLSDYIPEKWGMTFYTHSHAPTIAERNLHVRYTEKFEDGVVEVPSKFGNPLKTYSKERTLAEICRGSYKIDPVIINHAYLEYSKLPDKKPLEIYKYSEQFLGAKKVVDYIKEYMPEFIEAIEQYKKDAK